MSKRKTTPRPSAEVPEPDATWAPLRTRAGHDDRPAVDISVQVQPKASRSRIVGPHGDRLAVAVTSPPVDGEANQAVLELIATQLQVPRRDVELIAGQTGRRKTLRVHGLELVVVARRLGLAALSMLMISAAACENVTELDLRLVLPENAADLDAADNVSAVLSPGYTASFAVDGTNFDLPLELPIDDAARNLTLYLAQGETLLAWGQSMPFQTTAYPDELALLLGRPGRLSTFPGMLEDPDADTLVALARGRGLLLLEASGATYLLSEHRWEVEASSSLSVDFDASDGALIGLAGGDVLRLGWEQTPRAAIYRPDLDAWSSIDLQDHPALTARPGAAYVLDEVDARVLVLGGGTRTDVLGIDVNAVDASTFATAAVDGITLDGPRSGATAIFTELDAQRELWLIGGDDPSLPIALRVNDGATVGAASAWTGAACMQHPDPAFSSALFCVGGQRDGQATADAFDLTLGASPQITLRPSFLPVPVASPMLFSDAVGEGRALYVQGEGVLWRVTNADGAVLAEEMDASVPRVRGGHSVQLDTGVTFLAGGTDAQDEAVDQWLYFAPTPAP